MTKRAINEGGVYWARSPNAHRRFRRVIQVLNGKVFYSAGGDKNYCCTLASFKKSTTDKQPSEANHD